MPGADAAPTTRSAPASPGPLWSTCVTSTGARSGAVAPDDADWNRELDARLRRVPEVRAALERMWPVLSGGELVHDLFSFSGLIRSASSGILDDDEQALLVRDRSPRVRDVAWTEADLALIDEADARLGPPESARPRRRRGALAARTTPPRASSPGSAWAGS